MKREENNEKYFLYYFIAGLIFLHFYANKDDYCFPGVLSYEQLEKILATYNGSGVKAKKYGSDAIKNLKNAIDGKGYLYFYEK